MNRNVTRFAALLLTLAAYGTIWADGENTPAAMSKRVDELLSRKWEQQAITPAPPCSDSEFLRRAYLDLTGVIPPVAEVRRFLSDTRADKRARLIRQLLATPSHAAHLANIWRGLLIPDATATVQPGEMLRLHEWLRIQFADNMRFDRIVADLLMADEHAPGTVVFFTSHQVQPEKLAASTARIFLGLQIECAQCHDHPYDQWTQRDFWGLAAFFARLEQLPGNSPNEPPRLRDRDQGEVMLPDSTEIVAPRFPASDLAPADIPGKRREQLAAWIAGRDNPYLAQAVVNRVWAQFFGRGLVDPVDDFGPDHPPSHPALLDDLTRYFVRSGFDLRGLYSVLANTRAYQLSSRTDGALPPPESFARMAIKPLTAEQLYDSLSRIVVRTTFLEDGRRISTSPLLDEDRQAFLAAMEVSGRSRTDYRSGILQALSLLNGAETTEAADPQQGGVLKALRAPLFTDSQRIETLFLATLARPPRAAEADAFVSHVETAETDESRDAAFGDVLWALANSAEFALNH